MKKAILLGVNIDHVATVREARGGIEPSVIEAARIAEEHGADGITVHLREDRRHIHDKDVASLRKTVTTRLNLEMSLAEDIVRYALRIRPDQVTFVPEKRQERTTEGGLDVVKYERKIGAALDRCKKKGIIVSLFINPVVKQIAAAEKLGADALEFHTGDYAEYFYTKRRERECARLFTAAERAHASGMRVLAGHGLNYENCLPLCKMPYLEEVNIGHSIISRAVMVGLGTAVQEMKNVLVSQHCVCA